MFLDSRKNHEAWDIIRLAWMADYDDAGDSLSTFRSTSPNNDTGYSNSEFDDLLDRAASTADARERRDLLESAERLMLSQYPVMPLYFLTKKLAKPFVKDVHTSLLDRIYSRHLSLAD